MILDRFRKRAPGLGYLPDEADTRDKPLKALISAETPPPSVDLSPAVDSVLNQLWTSSCVAHAWAQAIRTSLRLDRMLSPPLPSILALYSWARAEHGAADVDAGTYLRTCAKGVMRFGLPPEHVWPFDPARLKATLNKPPPFRAYRTGHDLRGLRGYYRCYDLNDVRLALASNKVVVFGITVGRSFLESSGPETIDVDTGGDVGGHALTCVGYAPGRFLVVSSWGDTWRRDGFAWLTERRMAEASDKWAVDVHPEEQMA